jgi:hypothetical protein
MVNQPLARTTITTLGTEVAIGVTTQPQVDTARTALDVGERTLDAMQCDRDVIAQQMKERRRRRFPIADASSPD